jgi:hypothetical protein
VRKLAAILLMLVLIFNLCGYRMVISLLQNDADNRLETLLDNNEYDESQLVEIRVALNMPYQQRYTEFERHYGEIQIDGKSYTYVKRKIEGDVVIFKCIANHSKQVLTTIKNDLAQTNSSADINTPGKQTPNSLAKSFFSDYDDQLMFLQTPSVIDLNFSSFAKYSFFIPEISVSTPHQPPRHDAFIS